MASTTPGRATPTPSRGAGQQTGSANPGGGSSGTGPESLSELEREVLDEYGRLLENLNEVRVFPLLLQLAPLDRGVPFNTSVSSTAHFHSSFFAPILYPYTLKDTAHHSIVTAGSAQLTPREGGSLGDALDCLQCAVHRQNGCWRWQACAYGRRTRQSRTRR